MSSNVYINLHGQQGDIMSAMSVVFYRKELWGEDAHIIWYADKNNFDLFAHQDIEVREFPRGFGYPEMVEEENKKLFAEGKEPAWADWQHLMDENNHLNLELVKDNPYFTDAKFGAFPAPHCMSVKQRHGLSYPQCSKKVFGCMDLEWHPMLMFSDEERAKAVDFMDDMYHQTTIAIESFAGSGQSLIESEQVLNIVNICREVLGDCNFIFMSHKYLRTEPEFPEWTKDQDIYFAKDFTVRECALIVGMSNLLVSVSSGISVAASCWENMDKPFKTLQFCGSEVCSTAELYRNRHFELVTHDDKILDDAYTEMNLKLTQILNDIK